MKTDAALSDAKTKAHPLPGRKRSQKRGRHEAASLSAEAAFALPLAFFALIYILKNKCLSCT